MITPVVSFDPCDSLRTAMDVLLRRGFSGAPVTDSLQRVVGIVSELDCMKLMVTGSFHHEHDIVGAVVRDVMTDPIAVATPDMDLFAVVHKLLNAGVRRLPVVALDRLVGIVSRRDVLRVIRAVYG
jgi:CBS domain-containing protein